jgi:hypothetical protein
MSLFEARQPCSLKSLTRPSATLSQRERVRATHLGGASRSNPSFHARSFTSSFHPRLA